MNVLFIHPGTGKLEIAEQNFLNAGAFLPPLGLLYLSKILEINGHKPEIIDCTADDNFLKTIEKNVKSFDVVGITTYCQPEELYNAITVSNTIKQIDPDIPIIVGGPHCSLLPESTLKSLNADISVIGNAEDRITSIIEAIKGKSKISTIPGIYYKQNGKIKYNPYIKKKMDINEIPFPSRHLVDKYNYGHMLGVKIAKGKLTSISTSQGCIANCRFCNLHAQIQIPRIRNLENIKEEIKEIVDNKYKTLVFVDDNFMIKKDRVEHIMDFIIKNKYDLKLWIFGARADSADENLWKKMKKAGVELMNFGFESGNQDVLNYYNKKLTLNEMKKALNLSKKMGFFVQTNYIIGAPIETKSTIEDTIKFASKSPADIAIFYLFTYTYKSQIWQEAVDKGLIQPDQYRITPDVNKGLGNLTKQELMYYINKANKKFYFNPSYILREIKWIIKNRKYQYMKLGYIMLNTI